MITGTLKSKIDRVWDAFWSGGISNPLEVIEQITYLLFIRRLDMKQQAAEAAAQFTGEVANPVFGPGDAHLRWSNFKNVDADDMFTVVRDDIFPFLRGLGEHTTVAVTDDEESTYAEHLSGARFTIPSPALLSKVVDMLDEIDLDNRDTNGDLYEYLLSKIASAGVNGQFRTPRHIISTMVDMMEPTAQDTICDPACGTAGFLMEASEYIRANHPEALRNKRDREHFHRDMFHGFDFDSTMLRIGSMNMLLHGVDRPDIRYRDSLSEDASGDRDRYSLILANPPFAGSLDYEQTSADLLRTVKTKKTELLFLALFLKLLKPGGRAAVIVPDGVLFGSSKVHKTLRTMLVEDHKLDAVVKLPSGVFKPYAGVSTAILFFTRTDAGGTDDVWFYDVQADGFSLDDKRNPVDANDLPQVVERWRALHGDDQAAAEAERTRARTERSFVVPKAEIAGQDYDLSINRYKEIVYEEVEYREPLDIIADVEALNKEIEADLAQLKEMLK
ncbi:type I restriction-modification system subunit M [Brevibacterium sp. 50QC2O2]|uniref:type I restriction-modification system subunit M n=1 Tax=Brevibacterium sp. 50QC2O2 TaxID=2968459 RepID=UPI00211C6A5D|nr:class I SAM-dependent DNA methyltransferase [Brevibacterium sp. 50QC2O2]MCQ9388104.1 type I restriction-modification system subunit M [Brevibacterium sp. 50QC2O2]